MVDMPEKQTKPNQHVCILSIVLECVCVCMVIVAGIGHGDMSSNHGLIAFHIALIPLGKA